MTLLSAQNLSACMPGDAGPCRVLDAVDLSLEAGEVVDVIGPSGSGKTTLLRALARLLPDASGELTLEGVPAEKIAPALWRSRVALLPQRAAIVTGTVRDNLVLPWRLKVRSGVSAPTDAALVAALERVHLDVDLARDASRLSVGQAARVALLRVLLTEPKVLLLDEPDANLDEASATQVRTMTEEFSARGGAVVRVRHQPSDSLADRRYRLESGRLALVQP